MKNDGGRRGSYWNKRSRQILILRPLMSTWLIAIPMWARAVRPTCTSKERSNSRTRPQTGSGISFSEAITTAWARLKNPSSPRNVVRLYPDHYWGENNLQFAYEAAGRYGDAVAERTKQVQLHPNDYLANLRAWWAVENWSKDPGASQQYYEAALRLSTPELQEGHPLSVNLAFFKAYQFLRQGNPGQALAEADRLAAQTANLQSSEYRQSWLGTWAICT